MAAGVGDLFESCLWNYIYYKYLWSSFFYLVLEKILNPFMLHNLYSYDFTFEIFNK